MPTTSDAGRRREPPRSISGAGDSGGMTGVWRPGLLGTVVRASRDLWRESFFLMIFNAIYAVTTIPGILLLLYALLSRQIGLAAVGVLAMAAWPFTSFGLYHAAGQAVARERIHLSTFFAGGRRRLGLAYRWGALNLAVVGVLSVNAFFYLDPQAPLYGSWLGSFLGAFFLLGSLVWMGAQACLLGLLETHGTDSLRTAWRDLRLAIGRAPGLVFGTVLLSVLLFVAGIAVLPLGMLLAFACAAVLSCRMAMDLRRAQPIPTAARKDQR